MSNTINAIKSAGHLIFRGFRHIKQAYAFAYASLSLSKQEELSHYYGDMGNSFWAGSLACPLNLSTKDPIVHEHLDYALKRKDPTTGDRLPGGRIRTTAKLCSYEILFPVYKSVSIAALFDPRIRDLFERLVRHIIKLIEKEAMCRDRRGEKVWQGSKKTCGNSGTSDPSNGILVAVIIEYSTRRGDPSMHAHGHVMNLTRDEDGRYIALDFERILPRLTDLSILYDRLLRKGLKGLGYRTRKRGKYWELAHIPDDVIRKTSQMRQAINKIKKKILTRFHNFRNNANREPDETDELEIMTEGKISRKSIDPDRLDALAHHQARPDKDFFRLDQLRDNLRDRINDPDVYNRIRKVSEDLQNLSPTPSEQYSVLKKQPMEFTHIGDNTSSDSCSFIPFSPSIKIKRTQEPNSKSPEVLLQPDFARIQWYIELLRWFAQAKDEERRIGLKLKTRQRDFLLKLERARKDWLAHRPLTADWRAVTDSEALSIAARDAAIGIGQSSSSISIKPELEMGQIIKPLSNQPLIPEKIPTGLTIDKADKHIHLPKPLKRISSINRVLNSGHPAFTETHKIYAPMLERGLFIHVPYNVLRDLRIIPEVEDYLNSKLGQLVRRALQKQKLSPVDDLSIKPKNGDNHEPKPQ